MRHTAVCVMLLTITIAACDVELFSSEPSSEPGSLEGWAVRPSPGNPFGDCGAAFPPIVLQGATASDTRSWVVGASVDITPLFDRPCGFFTKCLPLNAAFSTSRQDVWQIQRVPSTAFRPRAQGDAVGAGVARIGVSVEGQPFGDVELRAVSPDTLQVDRLILRSLALPGAIEPLESIALATNGFARVLARLFDASGDQLCGQPLVSVTASGLTVLGGYLADPESETRANGTLTLQADSTAGRATVTLSVGDASRTIDLDVVNVAALTDVEGSLLGSWPNDAHIRVRALAGQQEVAGALVRLENLTPSVYQMFHFGEVTILDTREPAVYIRADSTRTSSQGQVRLSIPGATIAPVVFEFTVP